jgi:cytochrome b pre-mRNA-processing protein 3
MQECLGHTGQVEEIPMFQRLFGRERAANRAIVDALYASIVAAARQPVLYSDFGVPDTPLGRFELISVHLFLTLRRLREKSGIAAEITQELVDRFFLEVDHSLRELGIGDTSVPKRARKLASMFYGRIAAYDQAVESSDVEALGSALARNIRPDAKDWKGGERLARYILDAAASLASQSTDRILAGTVEFPTADAARPHAA